MFGKEGPLLFLDIWAKFAIFQMHNFRLTTILSGSQVLHHCLRWPTSICHLYKAFHRKIFCMKSKTSIPFSSIDWFSFYQLIIFDLNATTLYFWLNFTTLIKLFSCKWQLCSVETGFLVNPLHVYLTSTKLHFINSSILKIRSQIFPWGAGRDQNRDKKRVSVQALGYKNPRQDQRKVLRAPITLKGPVCEI